MQATRSGIAAAMSAMLLALAACGGGTAGLGVAPERAAAAADTRPRIVDAPDAVAVDVGAAAQFKVRASGGSLRYQWYRNAKAIRGATASRYSIGETRAADNGARYSVVVSNRAGSVASRAVKLTVRTWQGVRQDSAYDRSVDLARGVAVDRVGNVAIAGYADAFDGAVTALVVKYSSSGRRLWTRFSPAQRSGTNAQDAARAVAFDSRGNVIVVGDTPTVLPDQIAGGGRDVTLLKYSPAGKLLWARQLGSRDDDTGRAVAVTADDSIVIAGDAFDALPLQPPVNGKDSFVAKYDAAGKRLWLQQYDVEAGSDEARGLALDAAGNIYVAGQTNRQIGGRKSYLRKLDPQGVSQWQALIDWGFSSWTYANAVGVSADGQSIYIAGRTFIDHDNPAHPGIGFCCVDGDGFVARYDGSGRLLWSHNIASQTLSGNRTFDDDALAIAVAPDGEAAYVAGFTAGLMPGAASHGDKDSYVARYAADGARSWIAQLGSSLPSDGVMDDHAYAITLDRNGDLFVAGDTVGTFGKPGGNTEFSDWFALRMKTRNGEPY